MKNESNLFKKSLLFFLKMKLIHQFIILSTFFIVISTTSTYIFLNHYIVEQSDQKWEMMNSKRCSQYCKKVHSYLNKQPFLNDYYKIKKKNLIFTNKQNSTKFDCGKVNQKNIKRDRKIFLVVMFHNNEDMFPYW